MYRARQNIKTAGGKGTDEAIKRSRVLAQVATASKTWIDDGAIGNTASWLVVDHHAHAVRQCRVISRATANDINSDNQSKFNQDTACITSGSLRCTPRAAEHRSSTDSSLQTQHYVGQQEDRGIRRRPRRPGGYTSRLNVVGALKITRPSVRRLHKQLY